MDADRVEQFLPQKFGQLLGSVDSVHEDDHLAEGQGIEEMGKFFKFFILHSTIVTSLI